MNKGKFLLFFMLSGFFSESLKAQNLDSLCDSVFHAVQEENEVMLKNLGPTYRDLKALFDTNDVDMMNYQVGLRQKELEYNTRKDMKHLRKFAQREHIRLGNLVKTEYVYQIDSNEEGYHYSYVQAKYINGTRSYILHFVLIELNDSWFYGEGLRIEKVEVVQEEVPNYEKIDRELERKQKEREKARIKAEEDKKKAEELAKKQKEKEEKERLKAEEKAKKIKEKEERERLKAEEAQKREEAKEKKQKEREEAKRLREEEKEKARIKREEEKKRKAEEKRLAEEKKKQEKEEAEEKKKLEEKKKKQEKKEKKKAD